MFSLRFLLHTMALLGFALFLARCAGIAKADEPPLNAGISAWTGEATPGERYSYSVWTYSNAAASSTVTITVQLDQRVTAIPDYRTPNCIGVGPVVCTVNVFSNHPGMSTFTVRVNPGVCGWPLNASIGVRDDRRYTASDRTAVGLISRCLLYLPLQKR